MQSHAYERPLTLFDILTSVLRYRWRVVLVASLVLVLSAIAVVLFPKRYESEATLFVRLGRGSASLDPIAMGQTISIQESRETEMNSIIDMLQSRGLAERVVDKVGVERILKKHSWIEKQLESGMDSISGLTESILPAAGVPSDAEITEEDFKAAKRRDVAIRELQGDLKIVSPKKSTTINIAFRGGAPDLSQEVVQAIIDCYSKMHIDAYSSEGALDFFDEQFAEQEHLLVDAETSLRQSKNDNQVVTMRGKQESLQSEITDVKKMQLQVQADLQAAQARLSNLQEELKSLPSELMREQTSGIGNGATDAMRDRLYGLEILEKELAAKYSAAHPELVKVREQLRAARSIMDDQPEEREQRTRAINPVHQNLQNEVLLAEASLASLEAKASALDSIEEALGQRLHEVNNLEIDAERLQREIDIGREKHRNYARKMEEARINAALDRVAMSNVSVVAKPTLRLKHVSPSRPLLAALGIILACCSGFATAVASDYVASAKELQTVRQAERERYLKTLELETLQAERAAEDARHMRDHSMSGRKEIHRDVPVELIMKSGE